MADGNMVNIDHILRSLNAFARFHVTQLILLSLNMVSQPANILAVVFIGIKPDFQCRPYENSSILPKEIQKLMENDETSNGTWLEYGQCTVSVMSGGNLSKIEKLNLPCTNGYIYYQPKENSFISEWDLVCDKNTLVALSQTILVLGMVAGAILIPYFADRYGRKPVIVFCHTGIWVASLGVVFVPSYLPFVVLRFFIGLFEQGYSVPSATLAMELFPTERRAFIAMLRGLNWSLSCAFLGLLAYLLNPYNWRYLALAISLTATVFIPDILFLQESLRWLFAKGYLDRAKSFIQKAAKTNGLDFNNIWYTHVENCIELAPVETSEVKPDLLLITPPTSSISAVDDQKATFIDNDTVIESLHNNKVQHDQVDKSATNSMILFTDPTLRVIMFVQMYCWCIISMTYYGLYLSVTSLQGDKYINFLTTAACEFLAMLSVWKAFIWFGRKKALTGYFLIGAVTQASAMLINLLIDKESKWAVLSVAVATIGMFGMSGAFGSLWSYLPELIPTPYRNTAVGISSSAARIGSALSPFTALLLSIIPWAPSVIFTCGLVIGSLLILYLPETRGRQMPQTIDDVRSWSKTTSKKSEKAENSVVRRKQQNKILL